MIIQKCEKLIIGILIIEIILSISQIVDISLSKEECIDGLSAYMSAAFGITFSILGPLISFNSANHFGAYKIFFGFYLFFVIDIIVSSAPDFLFLNNIVECGLSYLIVYPIIHMSMYIVKILAIILVFYIMKRYSLYGDGTFMIVKKYKKFKRHGVWTYYHPDGTKEMEEEWQNDYKNGKTIQYHENGQIKVEGEFKSGNKIGIWIFYCQQGRKEKEIEYKTCYSQKLTKYHENGNKKEEGEFKNEFREGIWIFWYRNGNKKEEGNYENGSMEGKWIFWKENGNISQEGEYENNFKEGKWICYSQEGNINEVFYKYNILVPPDEKSKKIIGYDLFGEEFKEKYRKCVSVNNHYFTEEGWKKWNKGKCPIDFQEIDNKIYVSDESQGIISVDNSEEMLE